MEIKKYFKRIIIILLIVILVFPFIPAGSNCLAYGYQDIVINEIAWMGNATSTYNEWIELYNATNYDIGLDGWTLNAIDGSPKIELLGTISAYSYYLLERSDDDVVASLPADLIYAGSLGNAAEVLELKDEKDNLIDRLDASQGWPAGDNDAKKNLERSESGEYLTSLAPGGTPKARNSVADLEDLENAACGDGDLSYGEECDDGNLDDGDGCNSNCESELNEIPNEEQKEKFEVDFGDVVINEFISDPVFGETEWVELYNNTESAIDLEGCVIVEGSGATTTLNGILDIDAEERFLVIENIKGNLNNGGDMIILKDGSGQVVDKVVYGSWDDGNINDNAEAAEDPMSVARVKDGSSSGNDHDDFSITLTATKGAANIVTLPEDENEMIQTGDSQGSASVNPSPILYSNDIVITEIYPNPPGQDSEEEFIELHNNGSASVDLTGWMLGDDSNKMYTIKAPVETRHGASLSDAIIAPGDYIAFYRSQSGIALNNTSDSIKLYQPGATQPHQEIKYENSEEGMSYNLKNIEKAGLQGISYVVDKNNWSWSKEVTPGKANIIETVNHPPIVKFTVHDEIKLGAPVIFYSASTTDPDGDELSYSWDFGDGFANILPSPEHTYFKAGDYKVVLKASDGKSEARAEKKIKIIPDGASASQALADGKNKMIFINEIVPAPAGDDKFGEWVELRSAEDDDIVLDGWKLDDEEGGSTPFILGPKHILKAGGFLVITRVESGISLNNSKDDIRLFDPFGELVNIISYSSIKEGKSYSMNASGAWAWTDVLTPGKENVIRPISQKPVSQQASKSGTNKSSSKKTAKQVVDTTLEMISELGVGTEVRVKGTVAVLPGALGTQYFYIVGSPGIQVYNFKKEFPGLKVGDVVEVKGELSEAYGEKRIKTSDRNDIRVLGHNNDLEPLPSTCESLKNEKLVRLVEVEGEITKKQGSILYVDDGTDEIVVYIKKYTGISTKELKTGDNIKVSGILGFSKDERRIFPRFMEDIVKVAKAANDNSGAILGESESGQEWEIAKRENKKEMLYYLLILAVGVIIILIGWIARKK